MRVFLIFILALAVPLLAANDEQQDHENYNTNYSTITGRFSEGNPFIQKIDIYRDFRGKTGKEYAEQNIHYQQTPENYTKIRVDRVMDGGSHVEDIFYFSQSGALVLAESERVHGEKLSFLYVEDNPLLYEKTVWNPVSSSYEEVEFKKLAPGEDDTALRLLKDSVKYYDAAQQFLYKLPE